MFDFFSNIGTVYERFWQFFGLNENRIDNIILTIIILTTLFIIKRYTQKLIIKKIVNPKSRYIWNNTIKYTYIALMILFMLVIWFEGIGNVTDFIGFISAGLVIALKDPILNFIAWIFIITTRPFEVGHRIEFDGVKGDIIDIGTNQFIINEIGVWVDGEQSTGRIIHIPNMSIFNLKQINYSKGIPYIWNELRVVVTFESDWQKTKQILTDIINEKAEKVTYDQIYKHNKGSNYLIFYNQLSPIVYTSVKDSGIQLCIRYLVDPKKRRTSEEIIWEACLIAFSKHKDIEWAYPTTRIYRDNEENENAKPLEHMRFNARQ